MHMMDIPQFARKFLRRIRETVRGIYYLYRGEYRIAPNVSRRALAVYGSMPTTLFSSHDSALVYGADFLPDRLTFSGALFKEGPHFSFARGYVSDPHFDYRETEYHKLAVAGHLPYPCKGRREAATRCKQYIYLINKVRREGYRPDRYGPIVLVECNDGTTIVADGKHRLAILLALGIVEFPAVLGYDNEVRHLYQGYVGQSLPVRFYRKSLRVVESTGKPSVEKKAAIDTLIEQITRANLETWADIYHPMPFYEFRDLTTQVTDDSSYGRLVMILTHCGDLAKKRVLDLGCNVGFYSFSLAKRGAHVTGIDSRQDYIDIASEVSLLYDVPVEFLCEPVTRDFFKADNRRYDIALCFSMLQWVMDQRGMEYGLGTLRALSDACESLFFDIAVNSGKSSLRSKEGEELAFVYDLLCRGTSYTEIDHIGDVHPYGADTRHVFLCHR